jgi:hypothetical protein
MSDENLYGFLERRERELRHQIAALKGQIAQIQGQLAQREHELAEIVRVQASRTVAGGPIAALTQTNNNALVSGEISDKATFAGTVSTPPELARRFAEMTIKELVVQSLLDNFPNGATAAQIREFIRDAYGRPIEPSSLRPQMHRLKADAILEQNALSGDIWNLNPAAKVGFRMYDHPTSRKAMKALQDEPDPVNALHVKK